MRLKEQLQLLSITDSMTKLFNRRYFENTAEHYFESVKRNKTDLSLIMIDVDNFKQVNDNYGHKIGDLVLIELANILLNQSRKSDIVCRFGGEEFIILLPQTNLEGADFMAEKIRKYIEKSTLLLDDSKQLKFTISLGVSQVNILVDKNIEDCIKRSDDALYEAKDLGKNRVCVIK